MTTKMIGQVVVVLAALAIGASGCGTDEAGLGEDGTGGAVTAAGTGGTVGAGGQGGMAPAGTGGASVSAGGTIGSDFTRADHDMCMNWPVCPDDVFSPLTDTGRVISQQCTSAFDGGRLSCSACMRKSTCEPFIGRCIARFLMTGNPSGWYASDLTVQQCRTIADSRPAIVPDKWALCTGDTATDTPNAFGGVDVGLNAKTVCKD